jgi:hypothetical protein
VFIWRLLQKNIENFESLKEKLGSNPKNISKKLDKWCWNSFFFFKKNILSKSSKY